MSPRVILVTDADRTAKEAVEVAASKVGCRCISLTGGRHPDDARLTPEDVEELIHSAEHDPVVLMVDDEGAVGEGVGEAVIRHLAAADSIDIIGVVAVASDTKEARPVHVAASVTRHGEIIGMAVNKGGDLDGSGGWLRGDTTEILEELGITNIIGIGDPGKMGHADAPKRGAEITTKALQEILNRSGVSETGAHSTE